MTASVSAESLAQLKHVSTATITMQLLKRGIRACAMFGPKPFSGPDERLVGPAYTLRLVPMREDISTPAFLGAEDNAQKIAIEDTPEGHVLVISGGGELRAGVLGDILVARLKYRGVAGVVSDASMRDAAGILPQNFPIFCPGAVAPPNIGALTPADIQCRVGCGGVLVDPGDIIVADGDGAVVIPRNLADDVARDGTEQERFERFVQLRVSQGRPTKGLYPPGDDARAEYQQWLKDGEPT